MNKYINYLLHPSNIIFALALRNIIHIPDEQYTKMLYKKITGMELNLDNPQNFNEKLQWLKLYDRKPEYTIMVDKYEAKQYVANIIGEEYIIPTLAVYDNFDDIDWAKLPNEFVIKCTHDSGGLVICKNKSKLDINQARKKINKSLKTNYYYANREWPYKNVKPRIIIEKYMATEEQIELIDYKFFCFNGEPKFLYVSQGLSNHATANISFVDMNYKRAEFYRRDFKPFKELPPKPENFELMKDFAAKLSNGVTFLRVDFYEIAGKIYFGELTFFPCSGYIPFEPEKYNNILGDMLELPKERIRDKNEK